MKSGLEVIKLKFIHSLKIKRNAWLLVDTCLQATNHCTLFWVWDYSSFITSRHMYLVNIFPRLRTFTVCTFLLIGSSHPQIIMGWVVVGRQFWVIPFFFSEPIYLMLSFNHLNYMYQYTCLLTLFIQMDFHKQFRSWWNATLCSISSHDLGLHCLPKFISMQNEKG